MTTINYDPNSKEDIALSPTDGEIDQIADFLEKTIKNTEKNLEFIVTNFLLIMELRARIVEKKIDWKKIQFKFENLIILHNEEARFANWPRGFGDHWENTLHRIIDWEK